MSCPECDEARRFAMEQARLASHVTRQENKPTPPQQGQGLPQSGPFHRG